MLESVLIQNFKGFKNTSIGPFRKVNLIIGGQNVGKTALLEGVAAALNPGDFKGGALFRVNEGQDTRRYLKAYETPGFFVHAKLAGDGELVITSKQAPTPAGVQEIPALLQSEGKGAGMAIRMKAWATGPISRVLFTAIPFLLPNQAALVQLFGQLILARKKKELVGLLQKIDHRVVGLDAIAPDGEHRIYVELEGVSQALPLNMLGHGFSRLVYLFSALLASDSKLTLIDEVENGIHYSALPTLFQGIRAVAQDGDVQSLITTHSWDCLRAACEVFEDAPDMFQVIRLERTGDNVRAVCIHGEQLLRMVRDDMEVR